MSVHIFDETTYHNRSDQDCPWTVVSDCINSFSGTGTNQCLWIVNENASLIRTSNHV